MEAATAVARKRGRGKRQASYGRSERRFAALMVAPALIVIAIGVDPSRTLVISQVVLSFGIPFALVPMILLTSRKRVMGALVNSRLTTVVASVVALIIITLNLFLLQQQFFG